MNQLEYFEDSYIEAYEDQDKIKYQQLTEMSDNTTIMNSNMEYAMEFANGDWTCLSSTVDDKGNVSNLMQVQITRIEKGSDRTYGTITLPPSEILKTSTASTFGITDLLQTIVQGKDVATPDFFISIYFLNKFSSDQNNPYELPYYVGDEPRCVVSYYQYNKLVKRYVAYKLKDKLAGAQLARIIYSKEMQIYEPKSIFDLKIYSIITGDYKFPSSFIQIAYSEANNTVAGSLASIIWKWWYTYQRNLMFSIRRSFYSPTGNTISTRISPSVTLTLDSTIINNKNYPTSLKIVALAQDMAANQVDALYQPKSTTLYVYKYVSYNDSYFYGEPNKTASKNEMNLKNNSSSMFNDTITFPAITSVTRDVNISFVLVPVKTIFIQNTQQEILIPLADLANII
jgi:hypothetical protein